MIARSIFLLIFLLANEAYAAQCGFPRPAYINGINTGINAARETKFVLESEIQKTHPELSVTLGYNQTEGLTLDLVESLYQKAETYNIRTADASVLIYGVISGANTGLSDAPIGFISAVYDFFASRIADLAALFTTVKPIYNTTLIEITTGLRDALASNSGVYIIGHSQGSLFANDALYLLDQAELSQASGRRQYSGTYFIAPAASSQYSNYGTGYTKFTEDFLNRLGLGLPANTSLFATAYEATAYANIGDPLRHGILKSYFNKDPSPPFSRSYARIAQKIISDLDALKSPCNYVESTDSINGQTFTVVADALLAFDYDYCNSVSSMLSVAMPDSRQSCMTSYAGPVVPPLDANNQPLPINFLNACNRTNSTVNCSRAYQVTIGSVAHSLLSSFTASSSSEIFTCQPDQFLVINQSANQRTCIGWDRLAASFQ